MIIDSIDNLTLNQYSYLDLLNELEVCKTKALIKLKKEDENETIGILLSTNKNETIVKLKKEDENVKNFIESKLYLVLKSNLIKTNNKYDYYLKSVEDYTKVINKEVFDILMKEGSK